MYFYDADNGDEMCEIRLLFLAAVVLVCWEFALIERVYK